MEKDIYSYIKTEESRYQTEKIRVGDNWDWNMRDHIQMLFHLKNGMFFTGRNDYNQIRAFRNVMEAMIDLANWTEDIEMKDVVFFIENKRGRVLSFFIKKYHDEVFVRKHNLDEYIDELTDEDNTYGGVLRQRTSTPKPKIIKLNTIAFCDQTDIMGGALGFKFNFSPDKLRSMASAGWGEESNGADISIEELIALARPEKQTDGIINMRKNQTTSKNIEVYIVRGNLPEHYLKGNDNMDDHYNQLQIRAFYTNQNNKKEGVCLYRKKEKEGNIKFGTTKPVHGRGLGRGEGEKNIHPQIWTNFLETHKLLMQQAGSKVLPWTDDEDFAENHELREKENLEMSTVRQGSRMGIIPTMDANRIALFENSISTWFEVAQTSSNAHDPLMGKEPPSGTTFRGQERTVSQGRGAHDRKRGIRAKMIEEDYRDWIIPDMKKEMLDKKFLATLSVDEMDWVYDTLARNRAIDAQYEAFFKGEIPADLEIMTEIEREKLVKGGAKLLLKMIDKELKDAEIKIGINVAGKQKNLADLSDKVLAIFQFAFANPQAFQQSMQIPALAKAFNDIMEFSGLNQADFMSLVKQTPQALPQPEEKKPELEIKNKEPQTV